jgi:hypothetical protein
MTDADAPQDGKKEEPPAPTNLSLWQRSARDVVIVGTGVFLLINEALSNLERPILIAAGVACFGLPFALRADERRR